MTSNDVQSQPQARGILSQGVDRFLSWLIGFPFERCNYTIQALRIPISDGLSRIELCANLFQPLLAEPLGTVLIRSPYGRGLPIAITARAFAARGYQVLIVSSRGTFGSGGEFDPCRTEVQDGKGVVEWMRQQPWYTGKFATIGGSYLGYVQWALLYDPPKDMVAAVPGVSPHDFARPSWSTGAMDLDIIRWADSIAHQEEPHFFWRTLLGTRSRRLETVFRSTTPLASNVEAHTEGKTLWLDNILARPEVSDPYYETMKLDRALEQAHVPILIITGWYDLFLQQSMEQYFRLKGRGCNVALTVGPWSHVQSGFAPQMGRHGFDWIEEHLGKRMEAKRTVPVQYFVTGAQEWKNASSFPPPTKLVSLYLQDDGTLMHKPSASRTKSSHFTFNPQDPTPAYGGNGLFNGGKVDDTALAKRSDVLIFDAAPLERDFEFCGKPIIELSHSTDNPFADIFARVSEVDAKGKSCNITETYKRLDPKRDNGEVLKLELNHCAHRFLKGKKIRILIAGGCFPQYARNHGVENNDMNGTEMFAVEHTVFHSEDCVSKVVFPVVE
jgi:putative CocE/NonD family hydrolase